MRILGIDPGLVTTGYGIIQVSQGALSVLEGGTIHTGSTDSPLETRLSRLYDGMMEVLDQYHPESLALEQLYSHYAHPSTAILMGHARGVICLSAARRNIPVFSYASTQIKLSLTGNGRASKEIMQRAIQAKLKLKQIPSPHDIADAMAIAICHHYMASNKIITATKT